MSVVLARQNSSKEHMRRPRTKKDVPAEQHGMWRKIFSSSRIRTKLRFETLIEARVMPAPTSKRPEDREFVVDAGASMHMVSKKRLTLR